MARLHELRDKLVALDSDLRVLHAREDRDHPGVRERLDRTLRQRDKVAGELETLEARAAHADDIRAGLANGEVRMLDAMPRIARV